MALSADGGVALAGVLAGAAQGHAVVDRAVVTNLGGLAKHDAHAVVDDEAAAYLCAGVDLYTRSVAADLRDHTREKQQVMLIAPMRAAMIEHGLHTGIQKQNLKRPFCRRVARKICIYGFKQFIEHNQTFSLNMGLDRYLSPVSGRSATIHFPAFSGRFASSSAACSAAPEDIPARMPSREASSLPAAYVSSSER